MLSGRTRPPEIKTIKPKEHIKLPDKQLRILLDSNEGENLQFIGFYQNQEVYYDGHRQ